MRTQTRRRATAAALVLLALLTGWVLWVAISQDQEPRAGLTLDGSGSGSVGSAAKAFGPDRSAAQHGSVDPDTAKSQTAESGSTHAGSSTGSGSSGSDTLGPTRSGTTGAGTTTTGFNGSASRPTGSGPSGSGNAGASGTTGGPGSHPHKPGHAQTDPPPVHSDGLSVSVGAIEPLFPGRRSTAPVTVTNHLTGDLALTDIRVSSPGAAGCTPDYLVMGHRTLGRSVNVTSHGGQVSTKVRFGLRTTAPDSCKGKTIPFTVSVTAVTR